jgi:hypothetical protein
MGEVIFYFTMDATITLAIVILVLLSEFLGAASNVT